LMLWSRATGTTQPLIPTGEFPDIAYPRLAPARDQVAFMVPEPVFDGSQPPSMRRVASGTSGRALPQRTDCRRTCGRWHATAARSRTGSGRRQ
jgi:hypothetical protein